VPRSGLTGPQIVRKRIRNLKRDDFADGQFVRHENQPVNFGCVSPRPPDGNQFGISLLILGFTDGLDEDVETLTHEATIPAQ
jgi:hypothetical protein